MLYSQGVSIEATRGEDRDVWKLLVDHANLFALTPSGLWLRETLARVFGVDELSADAYDAVEAQLASADFTPHALLDRFGVECLATTDTAGAPLDDHRDLAPRIRPTFRPDAVVALDAPAAGAARLPSSSPPSAAGSATMRRLLTRWPSGGRPSRRSARPRPTTPRRALTRRGSRMPARRGSSRARSPARSRRRRRAASRRTC